MAKYRNCDRHFINSCDARHCGLRAGCECYYYLLHYRCSYLDSLTSDPSLSASAGTYHVPPNPDTNTGSGFVTLNYYYAVVGPAGNAGTYVPVTITGSVTVLWGGVDGESEACINYANGGVNTKNYGPGVLHNLQVFLRHTNG